MKQIQSFCLLIFVGILWWGLVYPELCFTEGTYEIAVVTAEALTADSGEEMEITDEEAFRKLLEAGPGRIIVKSKMIRKISQ